MTVPWQFSLRSLLIVPVVLALMLVLSFRYPDLGWKWAPYIPAIIVAMLFGIGVRSLGVFTAIFVCSCLLPWWAELFTDWKWLSHNDNRYETFFALETMESWLGMMLSIIPAALWYAWQNSPAKLEQRANRKGSRLRTSAAPESPFELLPAPPNPAVAGESDPTRVD